MNCIPEQKPKRTKSMIKKKLDYIWKEVKGNPNIYGFEAFTVRFVLSFFVNTMFNKEEISFRLGPSELVEYIS